MLILSRREQQTIRIGKQIELKILNIKHKVIRIGIQAPKTIPIYREELLLNLPHCQSTQNNKKGVLHHKNNHLRNGGTDSPLTHLSHTRSHT